MKPIRLAGPILLLSLLIGCSEEPVNKPSFRISEIEYHRQPDFPEPRLYARRSFTYDESGQIDSIISETYTTSGSGEVTVTYGYHGDTVTVDNVNDINGVNHMQFIYEDGLLTRYISTRQTEETELRDTLDFIYEGGQLAGLDHQGVSYTVEWDANGNITGMTGGRGQYNFEYDNNPNPFNHLELKPLVMILLNNTIEHPLYLPNFVQYFSVNNVTQVEYPFNPAMTWEYEYNSAGLPVKMIWWTNQFDILSYEAVP